MPWVPESDVLGVHTEYGIFSHSVEYYTISIIPGDVDPETGAAGADTEIRTYYDVVITPVLVDPPTVTISGNSTLAPTISGYYGPCFQEEITVMNTYDVTSENNTKKPTYNTFDTLNTPPKGIGAWQKKTSYDTFELIKFDPDMTRTRNVEYRCVASSGASTTKIITIQDLNWTPGMNALRNTVKQTARKKV